MEGIELLNPVIDSKHRAAVLCERNLEPLVTRTAKQDWRIHPDWVQRDRGYWMKKSKIIFDVFIEDMAQQRVMRQFGLRQMIQPPPTEASATSSCPQDHEEGG